MEMIEGQAPICYLVSKHDNISKENIKNLLYRCEKLYLVRSDAEKIFQNFIKLEHDPKFKNFETNKLIQHWRKLVSLLGQFESEHKSYHGDFIFDNTNLKTYANTKIQLLQRGKTKEAYKPIT